MATERTPLRSEINPPYVFMTNYNRTYKNKVRKFQCCICATILAVFITALVITISYSVNHDFEDFNGTDVDDVPGGPNLLTLTYPLPDSGVEDEWNGPEPNPAEIELAIATGMNGLKSREAYEEIGPTLDTDSPSYRHQQAVKTSKQARLLSKSGYIMDIATQFIVKNTSPRRGGSVGRGPRLDADWLPSDVCDKDETPQCPTSPYRTFDGKCNNMQHPMSWGVAMRPFLRYISPDYADGVSAPRKAKDNTELPSAREVSMKVHRPIYRDDPNFTVMLAVWGQFLDHDITATALSQGKLGKPISCCHWSLLKSGMKKHPECFIVPLGNGDPYYQDYNITCMEFVRSAPSPVCSLGPREQLNQVSSYIDGSVVYGANKEAADQLRSFQGGELKMLVMPDGRELLPISTDPSDGCNREEEMSQGRYCFMCGDARANENIHLVTLHLLLARHHNRLARRLNKINPNWDDEKLYQESRKIVSAQMQHITYNEFLPVILGPNVMKEQGLDPQQVGYNDGYKSRVDSSIANGFAASAFRFGHTLLPGLIRMIGNDTSSEEYVELHKMLFNPFKLYDKDFLDKTIRGAMNSSIEKSDAYFTSQVTQHLFEKKEAKNATNICGLDLVSLNIQRGRDHGLPGYVKWRQYCGLEVPKSFDELNGIMDSDSRLRLAQLYKTIEDIDMYTGALSEIPINGSLVGPTVTCLLTDQFLRLKQGDRFWYETSQQPQAFTIGQLDEIRKTTLGKIICDTSDGVEKAQPRVMKAITEENKRTLCADLPEVNLEAWREQTVSGTNKLKFARLSLQSKMSSVKAAKTIKEAPGTALKFGATVTNGTLKVNKTLLWDGSLPLTIPLEPLASILSPDTTVSTSEPATYDLGIVWKGRVVTGENQTATLEANFSVPFRNETLPTVLWLNGNLMAQLHVDWNTSKSLGFLVNGLFSSPIYLRDDAPKVPKTPLGKTKIETLLEAQKSVGAGESGSSAPIILMGDFSADKTLFYWSGKVTFIFPVYKLKLSAPEPYYYKKIKIGAEVVSGTISSQSVRVWSGSFPLSIPTHPFDSVAQPDTGIVDNEPVAYGHGIIWNGRLTADPAGAAHLTGTYSLPQYIHSNGISNFTIHWYNGYFDVQLRLLWNSTGEANIDASGFYSTPVYFSCDNTQNYLKTQLPKATFANLNLGYSGTPRELTPGEEQGPTAPLILHGAYSDDGNMFYWSGNVTLILPQKIDLAETRKTGLLTSTGGKNVRAPLCVVGGTIKINEKTVWSDSTPLAFPAKPFDSVTTNGTKNSLPGLIDHGVLFNCSVEDVDGTFFKVKGHFSVPHYVHSNGVDNFTVKWSNGEFSFRAKHISNTSVQSGIYQTSIYFNERRPIHYADIDTATLIDDLASPSASPSVSSLTAKSAVLILYGSYSLDRSIFVWNGNATFAAPQTPTLKTIRPVASGVSLGAHARGGSINVQGTTVWNGVLPVSFPTHPFDDVIDDTVGISDVTTYGHGILFRGSITKTDAVINLKGSFSLPTYIHGLSGSFSTSWYNGQVDLNSVQTWSSTNETSVNLEGSYTIPVYFQTRRRYDYLKSLSVPVVSTPNLIDYNVPSESSSGPKLTLVLQGAYSNDSLRFLWSGDMTLVLPPKPILTSEEPSSVKIGGHVSGGSLTCQGRSVWVGNRLPLQIPVHPFDSIIQDIDTSDTVPIYGHGVLWKGYLTSESPGTVRIWGTYSLPHYNHNVNSNVSIDWYNGDFAFQISLQWNNTDNLDIDGTYTTPIYFQSRYIPDLHDDEVSSLPISELTPDKSPSSALSSEAPLAPLILLGTYNADKSSFIWFGNVSLVVPIISV